ncbi:hypothetical protein DFS34DRAFT_678955 [Phlyctochytrium arcticum]|nr:hypothetical protein DFS34DRAFT_678955 [Phlyctochytrium arcticum]
MVKSLLTWSLEHPSRLNYVIATGDSFSQETYPHVDGLTLTNLQNTIQTTILTRLRAGNIDTSHISAASLGFLTAGLQEDADTLDTIMELLTNHMDVTDEDMMKALQLQESTVEDAMEAIKDVDHHGRELYYVRSWPVLVEDLYRLIAEWQEEELNPDEVYHWLSPYILLPKDKRATRTCHIRYVGKCTYPSVPFTRFEADLKQRTSGLLQHFTTILEREFPDSYVSGRTFQFSRATLDAFCSPRLADDRERIIIGFFGVESLLNQQSGGYYASYVPNIRDHTLFSLLKTNFFTRFSRESEVCSDGIAAGLGQWIQTIQQMTDAYPVETCTANHPMSDALLETYRQQATPRTVNGHTVMVLIGKDITKEDYLANQPFLTGPSRAGALTRDFSARLQSWENNHHGWDAAQLSTGPFPLVNLCPWPALQPEDAVLVQLGQYLRATRPLLLVVFSLKVNACAAANFYHSYGLPQRSGLDMVGLPRLQHYAPRDWLLSTTATRPPAGFATIVVPHYDPGYDKYGSQPTELRRLFDMCWMITVFIADQLLQAASQTANPLHDDIVHAVWQRVNPSSAMLDPKLANLYRALEQGKKDYDTYLKKELAQGRPRSTALHSVAANLQTQKAAKDRVIRAFFAAGAPQSQEREEQRRSKHGPGVVLKQLPTLLPPLRWFYAGQMPSGLRNSLLPFAPADATDDSWMLDPVLKQAAIDAKVTQLVQGQSADHYSPEKQRARVRGIWKREEYHPTLEGHEVIITAQGKVQLFWVDPTLPAGNQNVMVTKTNVARSLANKLPDDKRLIHFVPQGISFRDQAGQLMTINGRPTGRTSIVVPVSVFDTMDHGEQLRRLWQSELDKIGTVVPQRRPPLITQVPATLIPPTTKGRDAFRHGAKPEALAALALPIRENDAIWLLEKWLETDYPTGGTFNTMRPEHFPEHARDSLLVRFPAFLSSYQNFPYYPLWMSWLRILQNSEEMFTQTFGYCVNTRKQRGGATM